MKRDENVNDTDRKSPYEIFPRQWFPVEVFPLEYKELIYEYAAAFSVPEESIAASILAALSATIGSSIRVSVKQGWEEPVFLWLMITGRTGCGKTPFLNKLLEPIRRKEAEEQNIFKELMKDYEINKTIFEKKKKEKKINLFIEHAPLQPHMVHAYITDATVEALAHALSSSHRGILLFNDELAGLIKGCDQYKSSGNDRQKYLELWSCKPWKIHRITRPNIYVQNTGCSIVGGIQPSVFSEIFKKFSFEDGLLARFLNCDISDNENVYSYQSVSIEKLEFWASEVQYCYNLELRIDEYGKVCPELLCFDEEAEDEFRNFHDEYKQREAQLPEHAKGFIPKLISYCLRIAGILNVIHRGDKVIDVNITRKAIRITNYFAGEAMHLLGYYSKKYKAMSYFEMKCVCQLLYLKGEHMNNGKIKLSFLKDIINSELIDYKKKSSSEIANLVIGLGFQTKIVGGYSYIIWDEELYNKLSERRMAEMTAYEASTASTNL